MSGDTLKKQEAAELLGVHPKTIYRWTRQGLIPFWVTPGGQYRYSRNELLKFKDKRSSVS
jgi:excisionase family DNA binding protein